MVTGGAAGIGRGITEALLDEGARVVIADVEAPVLELAVKELADRGEVRGVVTDVSSPDSVEALAADVFSTEGACHLLFNNAGVTSGGGWPALGAGGQRLDAGASGQRLRRGQRRCCPSCPG